MLRRCFHATAIQAALCGILAAEGLKLGHVENDLSSAGGCSLQLPSEFARQAGLYVFVSDLAGKAVINLDGSEVHLALVKPAISKRKEEEVGDRSGYQYEGPGDVRVRLDYVVTGACIPTDESCRTTRYDATLSIQRGKQHKTVAGKAVCGKLE